MMAHCDLWKRGAIVASLLIILLTSSSSQEQLRDDRSSPVRIAIIGGGIGGTSTAHFLRTLFGSNASIVVFEKDKIGGRLATVSIAGDEYEIGGSIIHPRNLYMKRFVHDFGLHVRQEPGTSTMGIYDGQEFVFKESTWSIITILRLLWRYGFDVFRMQWTIDDLLNKFDRIYDLQDAGNSYFTIEGVLGAVSEEFVSWLSVPIRSVLEKRGFSERFLDELLAVATRANYGQNPDMMGFAGVVSLAGAMPGLWAVEGGNKRIPEELLKQSGASFIQARVRSVQRVPAKDATRPVFKVAHERSEAVDSAEFDIVVVAAPLENGARTSDIQFLGFDQPITNFSGEFRHTVATLLRGEPRPTTFGASSREDLPDQVITNVDVPLNIRCVAENFPVDFNASRFNTSKQVYKVFSTEVLNQTQLQSIFQARSHVVQRDWLAYPYYHPHKSFPGFVLSEGLFYPSAIEWAASAMEMAVIGGRNTAILAHRYWEGGLPAARDGLGHIRQEL